MPTIVCIVYASSSFCNAFKRKLALRIIMTWLTHANNEAIERIWHRVKSRGFKTIPLPEPFQAEYKPCLISTYRKDTRGNIQVCFNEAGKKNHVIVHVLSYVRHFERLGYPKQCPPQEVSHLCHRHECCEPSHLVLETRKRNHSRKNCVGYVWSEKHSEWIPVCNHNPKCLTSKTL